MHLNKFKNLGLGTLQDLNLSLCRFIKPHLLSLDLVWFIDLHCPTKIVQHNSELDLGYFDVLA